MLGNLSYLQTLTIVSAEDSLIVDQNFASTALTVGDTSIQSNDDLARPDVVVFGPLIKAIRHSMVLTRITFDLGKRGMKDRVYVGSEPKYLMTDFARQLVQILDFLSDQLTLNMIKKSAVQN